ncbi:DUF4214 domain-containing protein [Pseudoduganella armeniaca]|uniref:Protease n=1 Tax=Pseudoduganella armeniaca TaxID=2072590 RepID=A0A2R4CB53_9BURK|nr:DUF4214 domain-containing protein [Pseudoduganella armeniaca]AVR96833.1 protease [Pseudoduganella armeniaca]
MSINTGNNSLDSLVYGGWYGLVGQPVQLTYGFLTRPPANASDEDHAGFAAMSPTQQAAVRDALAKWASVANITFSETIANMGNLQFGTNDQGDASSAYAYLPEAGVSALAMYTNNQDRYNAVFTPGTYGPSVLLHEIGHMLGLKHPGNYDSTGSTIDGPFLPEATDNGDYTQMSYNEPTSWEINRNYATTPMLYDIQAIQYLYGANLGWHAGNDVYSFTNAATPQCIWDAGGDNTFDFSQCSGATVINLNAGAFSETAPGLKNVSIAYGVTVKTAIAGAGGATVYANDLGNSLQGGGGNDVFHGGAGSDAIAGGAGNDTVVFAGSYTRYTVQTGGDGVTVSGDGVDFLTGVETLQFSDRTLRVADLPKSLGGTAANDQLLAPTGNAVIDGGAGIDTVTFQGRSTEYQLTGGANGVTVAGNGLSDVLVNVERVRFADASLALDLGDGHAGQLFRLYEVAFDRAPDASGLGFWLSALDHGVALNSIAGSFISSPEFLRLYGQTDNQAYLTLLYNNALHRAPDAEGFAWHLNNLEHGLSRQQVLLDFSESIEFKASVVGSVPAAVAYEPYA